ncbi:hypothetical protein HY492_02460 [Candidatus Woesearchaeota archaeon]|nr:hypothetical protein [Candidatus Woesearchaeota archaeon]
MIEKLASYFVPGCMVEDRKPDYRAEIKAQLERLEHLIPQAQDFQCAMGYLAFIAGLSRNKEHQSRHPEPVFRDQAALRELLNAYRVVENRDDLSRMLWDNITSIDQLQSKIRAASTTENALRSASLASGLHHTRDRGAHRQRSSVAYEE